MNGVVIREETKKYDRDYCDGGKQRGKNEFGYTTGVPDSLGNYPGIKWFKCSE